ncbi:peptide deformylase [Micromonospora parva]|uniref:peptide deformylase n=1 Tax=Micromonospora parva TaxID=1464048 RepID=UPI0033EE1DF5
MPVMVLLGRSRINAPSWLGQDVARYDRRTAFPTEDVLMYRVEQAIAFVLDRAKADPVGLAFLVGERLMLTCAHVVNVALGRPARQVERVPKNSRVSLHFALLGAPNSWIERSAEVVAWLPAGDDFDVADVAVLRLGEGLAGSGAEPLRIRADLKDRYNVPVQMWGPGQGRDLGRHVQGRLLGAVGRHRLQVDEVVHRVFRVQRGFSGGPVWDPATSAVFGMLQAITTDDSAEVLVLDGALLERALAAVATARPGLVLIHDHGEVHYDGTQYTLRQRRVLHHGGSAPRAKYEMKVSVQRFLNDEAVRNLRHHAQHPLSVDDPVRDIGLRAWCVFDGESHPMDAKPTKVRHEEINFDLCFPASKLLTPGQQAVVEYTYRVSDEIWGQWYKRNIKPNTDRLSVEAHLPTELEPECWGVTSLPSETDLQPLPDVQVRVEDDRTIYSWDRTAEEDDLAEERRIRLDWFFWKRIPDSSVCADAPSVLRQFGIRQLRGAARGRRSSELPAKTREINFDSPSDRLLAGRVLAHLRRVAGWVNRYHSFKPEVSMGIAAPQLGMAYAIAIVKVPGSRDYIELVNPIVLDRTDEEVRDYEGCLSFFDVRGIVERPYGLRVRHWTAAGDLREVVLTGGLARSVAHEIDHLNGKVYTDVDRMPEGEGPVDVSRYRRLREDGVFTPPVAPAQLRWQQPGAHSAAR